MQIRPLPVDVYGYIHNIMRATCTCNREPIQTVDGRTAIEKASVSKSECVYRTRTLTLRKSMMLGLLCVNAHRLEL